MGAETVFVLLNGAFNDLTECNVLQCYHNVCAEYIYSYTYIVLDVYIYI